MLNPSLKQFKNKQGYLGLATISNTGMFKQEFFNCDELQQAEHYLEQNKEANCYNTKATFKTPKRSNQIDTNIFEMVMHVVDIDNHLKPFTKLEAIDFLNTNLKPLFDIAIPTPSKVVFSGRGLHVYYFLTGASDIKLWERTQKALTNVYDNIVSKYDTLAGATNGLEVDYSVNGANGIIRTIGTYNTKANCFSEVIFSNETTFTQQDFTNYESLTYTIEHGRNKGQQVKLSEFKGLNKQQVLSATQRELKEFKPYKREYTKETLNLARREDLFKIIEMRNVLGITEGYRNNLIKIAIQLLRENTNDIQMLMLKASDFNQAFINPLSDKEVEAWVRGAIKKQCYFTNKKIIEILGLTIDEQKQLATIISTKVKNRRFYTSHLAYFKDRNALKYKPIKEANREAKESKKASAREMHKRGLKTLEIALKLGLSQRTIERYIKSEKIG